MFVDRRFRHNRDSRRKKCIVCNKEGFWSTNHPAAERLKALRKNKTFPLFLTTIQQEDQNNHATDAAEELEDITAHILESDDMLNDDTESPPTIKMYRNNSSDNNEAFFSHTRDCAVSHALSAHIPGHQRYNEDVFFGILFDNGCSRASSESYAQYRLYCRQVGQLENIDGTHRVNCRSGISDTTSRSIAMITFLLKHLSFKVKMHIVDDDVPLLLSLAGMNRISIFYNNLKEKLVHPESGEVTTISGFYDHPFLL